MRKDISEDRPAQLLLMVDGTGGFRGGGLCHAEAGSGDWAAGECIRACTVVMTNDQWLISNGWLVL